MRTERYSPEPQVTDDFVTFDEKDLALNTRAQIRSTVHTRVLCA